MKKKIVISVFHAYIARNLLYGGLIERLKTNGIEPVLIVPRQKEEHFKGLFGDRAIVEASDTDTIKHRTATALLVKIAQMLTSSHFLWQRRAQRGSRNLLAYIRYLAEEAFIFVFGDRLWVQRLFRRIYKLFALIPDHERILEKYAPEAVFATDVMNDADAMLILSARRLGIRTIAMARSWDNYVSKGAMRAVPDRLIVNTHELKKEAIELHGVDPGVIDVVGLPQFDESFTGERTPRAEFMRSIGAPLDAKLLVVGTGGASLTDIDWQYCEIIKKALDNKRISHKVHVLVRNHPIHPADLSRFEDDPRFTIEYPGKRFGLNRKETELQPNEAKHLADTMYHSDLTIWLATTLGIDAAVFGKPQIAIAFDGYEKRPYIWSVRRFYDEEHMKKMIDLGGVHMASSPDDFVEAIERYLTNPSLDAEQRKKIIEQQLVFTDGRSGERLALLLEQAVSRGLS